EKYKAKRIRDRFTDDLLEEYCLALGIRLFDAEFYGPWGVLIEILDHLQAETTALTLIEARWRLGLENSDRPVNWAPSGARISRRNTLVCSRRTKRVLVITA